MSDFDYPTMNNYQTITHHSNFPYQNFFRANPLSENVQIDEKDAGYVQPRKIITTDFHRDPIWIDTFEIPCGTILPKSLYYKQSGDIILPP